LAGARVVGGKQSMRQELPMPLLVEFGLVESFLIAFIAVFTIHFFIKFSFL
jgi:hypothetical protein